MGNKMCKHSGRCWGDTAEDAHYSASVQKAMVQGIKKGPCRYSEVNMVDVGEVQQVTGKCAGPVSRGLIIMNNISCVKLIVRISGRIWDVTVWSAPTAFLWIMGRLSSFPQMSVIITNVSRDNGRPSRLPRSSFYQLVQRDSVDELVIVMCNYASLQGQQTCRVFICCGNCGRGVDRTKKIPQPVMQIVGFIKPKDTVSNWLNFLIG